MKGARSDRPEAVQHGFRFRLESLEIGDVIASTIPGNLTSKVIRLLTLSDFSHVSLYVGDGGCIEADENVARFSLRRVGCNDPRNVRVLRLNSEAVPRATELAQAAGRAAEDFLGQRYWTVGAFACLLRIRSGGEGPTGVFCSQLVASAYANAAATLGVDNPLGSGLGRLPEHIRPRDIVGCEAFKDVSSANSLFEPIQDTFEWEFVDAERDARRPHLEEVRLGLRVCEALDGEFAAMAGRKPESLIEAQERLLDAFMAEDPALPRMDELLLSALRRCQWADSMLALLPKGEPLRDPEELAHYLNRVRTGIYGQLKALTAAGLNPVLAECRVFEQELVRELRARELERDAYRVLADAHVSSAIDFLRVHEAVCSEIQRAFDGNRRGIEMIEAFIH